MNLNFHIVRAKYLEVVIKSKYNYRHLIIFIGAGNSTVPVYQAGDPSSRPARSACYRKVESYHCVTDSITVNEVVGHFDGKKFSMIISTIGRNSLPWLKFVTRVLKLDVLHSCNVVEGKCDPESVNSYTFKRNGKNKACQQVCCLMTEHSGVPAISQLSR